MNPSEVRIVTRLVAVTIAVGLVTGVVGLALVLALQRAEGIRDAETDTLAVAERTATLIDANLSSLLGQLELLASRPAIVERDGGRARTELAVALRVSEDFDELLLLDRRGVPVAAVASARLLPQDELPIREDLTGDAVAEPTVRVVAGSSPAALELAVPVEDPPGTVVGALVGTSLAEPLVRQAEARLLGDRATAFIVDDHGRILAHPDQGSLASDATFPVDEVFPDGRVIHSARRGDMVVLLATERIRSIPAAVVVEQPEDEALQLAHTSFNGITLVFIAVLGSMVAGVVVVGRRLLQPLAPLADAVRRLEAGDLDARAAATGGSGELAVLAAGFDRMADSLQERQLALEEAEHAARRSEERLRALVEGVEDYAILLLDTHGVVASWNTGASRVTGYDADEGVGRDLRAFFDESDPPPDPLLAARARGRGEAEGWCRRADGVRYWAQIVAVALSDEGGRPHGFAVVVNDHTERRAAREALESALERERRASDELRDLNRLKDEFLAMAAHELQTPLAAILGAAAMLDGPLELSAEDEQRCHDIINAHAGEMRGIVERLLDFSRVESGRVRLVPQRIALREELQRCVELLAQRLDGHDVQLDVPDVELFLDPDALRHVVSNLVTNAAKFSPPGSVIAVEGSLADHELRLQVRDHGIGIPPDELESIFEVFRQGTNRTHSVRGTGVGLAIVRRYVELLGGEVHADSTVGEGSVFTIHLPRVTPLAARS